MAEFLTLDMHGWIPAIVGMRAPLKSYDKLDTVYLKEENSLAIGQNDYALMKKLSQAGPEHSKWMRQVQVWVKITAPLYFFSEWDTYKVGTTANSESTMHTITKEHLTLDDLELPQNMLEDNTGELYQKRMVNTLKYINDLIDVYNDYIKANQTEQANKVFTIIKATLPCCYKQTRYVNLNYAVLANMYRQRKNHRLPQWSVDFVSWIKSLPFNEFITQEFDEE